MAIETPRSGFRFSPTYSWERARLWEGSYSREEFEELSGEEQSRIIALYLIDQQIQAVLDLEHSKEMRRQQSG